jgi:hypothetical protein
MHFSKVAQRIYLSNMLFYPAMQWIDNLANSYITNISQRSPIATSTPAPRLVTSNQDINIETIYRRLTLVTKLRKQIKAAINFSSNHKITINSLTDT